MQNPLSKTLLQIQWNTVFLSVLVRSAGKKDLILLIFYLFGDQRTHVVA